MIDARCWAHYPRARIVLSTIPVEAEPWQPSRPPTPVGQRMEPPQGCPTTTNDAIPATDRQHR
eukprot:10386116-Prorocentrum_lima.AAC.1